MLICTNVVIARVSDGVLEALAINARHNLQTYRGIGRSIIKPEHPRYSQKTKL